MKWITILLITTCLCPLRAQEQTKTIEDKKADIALSYLKQIASGDLDVAKHTALSANCSVARRQIIRNQLKLAQEKFVLTNDNLSIVAVKNDGRFSATLIKAENPAFPLSARVLAVALLHTNDGWKPAPIPGSFANTGYGYDEEVEKTVKALEKWMATEKIKRETAHRNKANNEFHTSLKEIEKELQLEKLDTAQSVTNFIKLCRNKNLMQVLAAMGASSGMLTNSLEDTISNVSRGLETNDTENDWQAVNNPSTVFEIMNVDEKRSEVAVGFYNPMLRKQSKVLYFPVEKKDRKTFVKLSPMLNIAWLPQDERWQQRWRHRRDDERELAGKIPATILKNTKNKATQTPEQLVDKFLSIVEKNNFREAIELLPRKGQHFEKEQEQTNTLANLASLWQDLMRVKSASKPKISVIKDSKLALAPLQYALPNNPGKFQTWNLWMIKYETGWQIVPENSIKTIKDDQLRLSMGKLQKRLATITQAQRKQLSEKMLSQVLKIEPSKLRQPVTEQAATKLFKQYRDHLRADDHETALSRCAVLKGTDDTRTLKNFNYALRGIDDHTKSDLILGVHSSGNWTGISARTESRLSGIHDYPLYLCINTHKGARILLDIDLRHASNKGRALINKSNWNKLKAVVAADTLKHIETIFARHEKLVTKDKEAEIKLHE